MNLSQTNYHELPSTTSIQLKEYQIPHQKCLLNKLLRYRVACDKSKTGTGKSYVFVKTAIDLMAHHGVRRCLVICTSNMVSTHQALFDAAGVPGVKIVPYAITRGYENSDPTHGLLVRQGPKDFKVTHEFEQWVQQGLLVIIDETQMVKNMDSRQTRAVFTWNQYIGRYNRYVDYYHLDHLPRSYVLAVSFTPVDQADQARNFALTMGMVDLPATATSDQIYQAVSGLAISIDQKTANQILNAGNRDITETTYELFVGVIFPAISSSMEVTSNSMVHNSIVGAFSICPEGRKMVQYGISLIHQKTTKKESDLTMCPMYVKKDRSGSLGSTDSESPDEFDLKRSLADLGIDHKVMTGGGIMRGNMVIQAAKTRYILIPEFRKLLRQNPHCKILFFTAYLNCIDMVMDEFREYNPLSITGRRGHDKKEEARQLFQEDNDVHRIICCISSVAAQGISLDDQYGGRNRINFDLPSYNLDRTIQCPGRTDRMNTKSHSAHIYVEVDGLDEKSIQRSVKTKSKVIQDLGNSAAVPPDFVRMHIPPDFDYMTLVNGTKIENTPTRLVHPPLVRDWRQPSSMFDA